MRFCITLCAALWVGADARAIDPVMRLTLLDGPLKYMFTPGDDNAKSAFSYHCFSYGNDGMPNYVHGTAQTFWAFEGPIDSSRTASTQLYAVNPFTSAPITGTLTLTYSTDFSAAEVSVSGCSDALCESWPATLFDGTSNFADASAPANVCLWSEGSPVVSKAQLIDHTWQGDQGDIWMCNSSGYSVVGSFTHQMTPKECIAEGLPSSCPLLTGAYTGTAADTSTGRGIVLTTWHDTTGSGPNLFAASSATDVRGFYCKGNDRSGPMGSATIEYCFELHYNYTLNASATAEQCTNYAPSPPPPMGAGPTRASPAPPTSAAPIGAAQRGSETASQGFLAVFQTVVLVLVLLLLGFSIRLLLKLLAPQSKDAQSNDSIQMIQSNIRGTSNL